MPLRRTGIRRPRNNRQPWRNQGATHDGDNRGAIEHNVGDNQGAARDGDNQGATEEHDGGNHYATEKTDGYNPATTE